MVSGGGGVQIDIRKLCTRVRLLRGGSVYLGETDRVLLRFH